jgi:hypothetical protein
MPNVFFAYRLEHAGQHVGYLVCGILKGRPRVGFDRVVQDEQTLSELAVEFARVAGGTFRLAGNLPELAQLLGNVPALTFSELALSSSPTPPTSAALRKPSSAAAKKRLLLLVALIVVGAVGYKYGMAQYRAYEARKHPPPPQKSPAERYAEDILARSRAPSAVAAVAVPRFAGGSSTSIRCLSADGSSRSQLWCGRGAASVVLAYLWTRRREGRATRCDERYLRRAAGRLQRARLLQGGQGSHCAGDGAVRPGRTAGQAAPDAADVDGVAHGLRVDPPIAAIRLHPRRCCRTSDCSARSRRGPRFNPVCLQERQVGNGGPLRNAAEIGTFPPYVSVNEIT